MAIKRPIKRTKYFSHLIGTLPKGCALCVGGFKTVVFITGLCPRHCSYCPISDLKFQKDVTFANEWPTSDPGELIREAELCSAKGAGFTGGDPLVKIRRTVSYIKALKKYFGKAFHIHLYTSFDLATPENLRVLYDAGLDEIRFHPDLWDRKLWGRIDNATAFGWDVGVEIPVVPDMKAQTLELMGFINNKVKFLNLNELEVSDAGASKLTEQGYKTKDSLSYGIKGSEKLAKELLRHAAKHFSYSVHYCTAKLKDKVQLAKRIQLRAKKVRQKFDIVNKDGTLTRGVIYLHFLIPSFNYLDALSKLRPEQRQFALSRLEIVRKHLMREYGVPADMLLIDRQRIRLLTNVGVVQHLAKQLKDATLRPAIVTEYPTWDALIVELEWV
ncbi:MAG: radical SAM protein [Candidatus Woesearchaeota archaeon]